MDTRLYINTIGELHNPNLNFVDNGGNLYDEWWNFPSGTTYNQYGIVPAADTTQRTKAITQDLGINSPCSFRIALVVDGDPLTCTGEIRVIVGSINTMTLNIVAHSPGTYGADFEIQQSTPDNYIGWKISISGSGGTLMPGQPVTNMGVKSLNILQMNTDGNWVEVDLYDDINIPLTFNVADVRDITKKDSNYSLTVKLPNTQNNAAVFGLNNDISRYNSTFEMLKQYQSYIEVAGHRVFDGYIKLTKVVINDDREISYEANFCSAFIDFISKLGTTTLRGNENPLDDLDFSEYKMVLDSSVWFSYTDPLTYGKGCYFAPVDKYNLGNRNWINGTPSTENFSVPCLPMYYDELTPYLYYKEILNKIFEWAGYSYVSDFIDNTSDNNTPFEFEKIVYPAANFYVDTRENVYSRVVQTNTQFVTPNSVSQFQWNTGQGTVMTGSSTVYGNNNNELTIEQTNGINAAFGSMYLNTFNTAGIYSVYVNFPYNIYLQETAPTGAVRWYDSGTFDFDDSYQYRIMVSLILKRGGVEYHIYDDDSGYVNYENEYLFVGGECLFKDATDFQFEGNLYVQSGDQLYIKYTYYFDEMTLGGNNMVAKYNGTEVGFWHKIQFLKTVLNSNQISLNLLSTFTVNGKFDPTDILNPKTKKVDLVNDVIKKFNLYVEDVTFKKDNNGHYYSDRTYYPNVRPNEPVLRIEPRDLYYANTDTVRDWTDRADVSSIEFERIDDYLYKRLSFNDDNDKTYHTNDYNEYNYTEGQYGEEIIYSPYNVSDSEKTEVKTNLGQTMCGVVKRKDDTYLSCPYIFTLKDDGAVKSDKEYDDRMLFVYHLKKDDFPTIFTHRYFALYERPVNPNAPDWSYTTNRTYIASYSYLDHFNAPFGRENADLNWGWANWYYQNLDGRWVTSNNCYNTFYKNMVDDYNSVNARLMRCKMYLKSSDISDFKLSDTILVNGVAYHINKIKQWRSNYEPVEVELIKIISSNSINNQPIRRAFDNVNRVPVQNNEIVTLASVRNDLTDMVSTQNNTIVKLKDIINKMDERIKKLEEGAKPTSDDGSGEKPDSDEKDKPELS